MLAQARAQYPALRFEHGVAEALPFPDTSFDAVAVNLGIPHFARPERALAEAFRILRPGDRIGFTVWAGGDPVSRAYAAHGTFEAPLPPGPPLGQFSEAEASGRALREAGFTHPTMVRVPLVQRVTSADVLPDGILRSTVRTAALLRAQTPAAQEVIRAALREELKSYEKDGIIEVPNAVMLSSAQKPT